MAPPTIPSLPRAPYRYLGGLRFMLASCVMVQHTGVLLPSAVAERIAPLEIGSMAVCGFFIVSGFVIAEAVAAFYARRPAAFLANRLLRLVPTYAAALCISAFILRAAFPTFVPAVNETPISPERFAASSVVLNMLALFPFWRSVQAHFPVPEILEQGWALRIEFLFYLAMAACVATALYARMSLIQVLTAAGTALLVMLSLVGRHADGTSLENAPYFVLGVAFYYLVARKRERWLPGAFCLTATIFVVAHMLGRAATFGIGDMPRDRLGELLLLAAMTGIFVALVALPSWRRAPGPVLTQVDRLLGEVTYPLYLMHWAVLIAAKTWLPHGRWSSVGLAFAGAYALSVLTVIVIEEPVAKLRRLVRTSRAEATPGEPSGQAVSL